MRCRLPDQDKAVRNCDNAILLGARIHLGCTASSPHAACSSLSSILLYCHLLKMLRQIRSLLDNCCTSPRAIHYLNNPISAQALVSDHPLALMKCSVSIHAPKQCVNPQSRDGKTTRESCGTRQMLQVDRGTNAQSAACICTQWVHLIRAKRKAIKGNRRKSNGRVS